MATLIIDTHKFITQLKAAGMEEKQAAALVRGLKEATHFENIATKDDLRVANAELKADLIKWLMPTLLGQVAVFALVVKFLIGG